MIVPELLPFTDDRGDPLFVVLNEELEENGNQLSIDDRFQVYLEARADIMHAVDICGGFWVMFRDTDVIDVRCPITSFYNLLFSRVRLSVNGMSKETVDRSFRLLTMSIEGHEAVAETTNTFLNAMIDDLRTTPDPILALALF